MSRLVPIAAGILVLALPFVAVGCAPTPTAPSPSVSAEAPEQAPVPTPTPAQPEPTFAPGDLECDSIITQDSLDIFAVDELTITPQADFVAKMKAEGQSRWVEFDAAGGTICQVGNAMNAFEIYGYVKLEPAASADLTDELAADGYLVNDFGLAEGKWLELPGDVEGIDRVYASLADGSVYFGAARERVEEIYSVINP